MYVLSSLIEEKSKVWIVMIIMTFNQRIDSVKLYMHMCDWDIESLLANRW